MLRCLLGFCFFLVSCAQLGAQTFWTEDFGSGCSQAQAPSSYTGPNGAWSVTSTGTNSTSANDWFISATEAGMGIGNCGDGCLNNGALTNRTLHVGAHDGVVATDPGAAYDAGGLCGFLGICVTTDKRADSPTINCTGYGTITLSFSYIQKGSIPTDACTVWYFNGATWSQIAAPPATNNTGCAGQGKWTAYSVPLPASADNNANVKIGFRWVNNDDGVGSDPSFAVDDIALTAAVTLPVELLGFEGTCKGDSVRLAWSTASEKNNDYFLICRSTDGIHFDEIGRVNGAGNSEQTLFYTFTDRQPPEGVSYYLLKQTDFNGYSAYMKIIAVNGGDCDANGLSLSNVWFGSSTLHVDYDDGKNPVTVEVYSSDGRLMKKSENLQPAAFFTINVTGWNSGIYFVRVNDGVSCKSRTVARQ